ncbi:MAG: amino acid ABC transporter permease [Candidatus Adiutrix sp.]|nr:amino acid ABC transporter permease [Candidatus Adiutrix sp.]
MIESAFYQALWPALFKGFKLSLALILPSAAGGLVLGVLVGLIRGTEQPRWLFRPCQAYVSLFRGTALAVQLFICYYGLPELGLLLKPLCLEFGLPEWLWRLCYPSAYGASVLVFILCSGAYQSEYIRGAILSIKRGQFLAARALGFSRWQSFSAVILPQALRLAWPGCSNEVIYLIKYSSLAYLLSARELTGAAFSVGSFHFRYTESFFCAALFYLSLVSLATWLFSRLERAWAVPGFGRS